MNYLTWFKPYVIQSFQRKSKYVGFRFPHDFVPFWSLKWIRHPQKRNKPFVCGIRVKTHRIAFQWFKFHTFGFERQLIDWLVLKTEIVFSSGFGWICEIRTPPTILNWFPPNLLTNEVGCKDESRKKLYVPEPDSVGLQNFTKFRVFDLGQDCANVQLVDLKPEASKQRLSSRCWLSKSQLC